LTPVVDIDVEEDEEDEVEMEDAVDTETDATVEEDVNEVVAVVGPPVDEVGRTPVETVVPGDVVDVASALDPELVELSAVTPIDENAVLSPPSVAPLPLEDDRLLLLLLLGGGLGHSFRLGQTWPTL
jgi:hypothetical protein